MTEQNARAYYAQREQQERDLAAAAKDPCAKAAHLEMAESYSHYISQGVQARNISIARENDASGSRPSSSIPQQRERLHLANG